MEEFDVVVVRFESNVNRRELPIPGLQRIFGIDEAKAQLIARSLPRVVKSRVTPDIAERYLEALRSLGAQVELRPCAAGSSRPQPSPSSHAIADAQPALVSKPESPLDRVELGKNSTLALGTMDAPQSSQRKEPAARWSGAPSIGPQPEPRDQSSALLSSEPEVSPALEATGAVGQLQALASDESAKVSDQHSPAVGHALAADQAHPETTVQSQTADSQRPSPSPPLLAGVWKPGTGDIIGGASLIAIGLFVGGSIFTGKGGVADYLFDVLGICWIGLGIYRLVNESKQT